MTMQAEETGETQAKKRITRVGRVTSDVRDRTIRVETVFNVRHPKYGKFLRRRSVFHAHDENNEARKGDMVEIVETRPLSKQKRWRLVRIVQKAPEQAELKA